MQALTKLFFLVIVVIFAQASHIAWGSNVQLKQYSNGGIYEGEFLDGKQHGSGKYISADGYEYDGQWVNGSIEGFGTAKYSDGSTSVSYTHLTLPTILLV